ncbi:hypothetical protein MPL3356_40265 [Mesorhizobium plurifarium]|uniref:Uncharacterized protein n=1 Tax=Mesorhizobium plurifarium TaxID=69974 RepID=A0A090E7P8_MESPL|nr:hypothetical protein MPL3356_40265 [Mesorhizobium plurifarium]
MKRSHAEHYNPVGLMSSRYQSSRRLLDLVGQVVHLIHPLDHALMKHRKPSGSVDLGALFAMHIEGRKHYHPRQRPSAAFVPRSSVGAAVPLGRHAYAVSASPA